MTASTTTPTPVRLPTAGRLLALSVTVNLVLLGLGSLLGGAFSVDAGAGRMDAGVLEVAAASIVPLAIAIAVFSLVATRVALVRRVWTPTVAVITLLSLGGLASASDLTTAVTLGTMHLVVGGLAAFAVPARLER